MDADVKARFDAIDAKLATLAAYTYPNGSKVQGTVQGIVRNELAAHASPAAIAQAVVAATGGTVDQATVLGALKQFFGQAAAQ